MRSRKSICRLFTVCCVLVTWLGVARGDGGLNPSSLPMNAKCGVSFDLKSLSNAPAVFPASEPVADGVRSFFYESVPYKGRSTRVFAYYGVPVRQGTPRAEKLPAMVLIHGGGGSAFDRWVKLWNSRGYAAIAMDLCGCVPVGSYGKWKRHENGGPPGWDASFSQLDDAVSDQWTFHAVSAIVLANSLIRSYPEVDAERIGVTGISWGGYLTSVVAGVDSRFKLAVPVYGCGFLSENSVWLPRFDALGKESAGLWVKQWDPSSYLGQAQMPLLWVNGTNDFAYPMDSWQKSYRLSRSVRTLCLRVRMPHGHGAAGENPEEIHVFANSILKSGKPLPKITNQGQSQNEVWVTYDSATPLATAELYFTRNTGKWQDRKWETAPAMINSQECKVTAALPSDAKVFYLNLLDDRQCVVSSQHVER